MNRGWLASGVIFILVLLQCLFVPGQASRSSQGNESNAELSRLYMSDWYVNKSIASHGQQPLVVGAEREPRGRTSSEINDSCEGPMDSPWPMLSYDSIHSGRSQYSTENNSGTELWQVHGDQGGEVWSSGIIDKNGTIYFGTLGSDSSLYAINPNGTRKWKYHANDEIWSTPALAEDGTIYVASWGPHLVALDQNGHIKWDLDTQETIGSSVTIAGNGTIYIGTMEGNLYAINPNGTEQWHLYLGGNLISTPAIGIHNTIYIGTTSHCLFAVNPNGTIQWQFQAGEFKGSPSIAADGTIYAPSFDGCLYALNPDGTMRWRASTGDSVAGAGVAVTADGTIYVGTEQLRAFYPNGTLKWCTDVQGSVYGTVPAVSADGTIYVTAGSNLVAVNPDGTVKWSSSISNEQSHSSPCIGQNDRVYVGSRYRDYGYLHAFGPGVPKKIEILQPQSGHLYFFGLNFGHLFLNHTIIIGAITIKVNVYSPDDIINVSFYIDSFHASVTSPPFEWRMDQQYTAKPQLKHTITVIGYYKGGPYWIESIPVIYVHL